MLSGKKLILLGAIFVLLAAIPLTLYFVSQQNEVRSRATAATTLSLEQADSNQTSSSNNPIRKTVGDAVILDVMMDPGSNVVSFAKLNITYDATKIATASPGIETIPGVSSVIKSATYAPGSATISLGIAINPAVGVDPTKTIRTTTKIAKITFKTLATTDTSPSTITFGSPTQVLSTNQPQDAQGENVLSTKNPAFIAIAASTLSPTPTGTISLTPTPTGATGTNQPPVCSTLNADRTATGTAPFSIAFTANGNDSDGTISKVTFDFGDGPVTDVVQAGGIGTNSVSTQVSHTYHNAGTYKATATLTDNKGGLSLASTSCTQTVTVSASSGSLSGTPIPSSAITPSPTLIAVISSSPTPTPIPFNSPTPTIASPGPQNQIIGLGVVATMLSIVGALLFFAL